MNKIFINDRIFTRIFRTYMAIAVITEIMISIVSFALFSRNYNIRFIVNYPVNAISIEESKGYITASISESQFYNIISRQDAMDYYGKSNRIWLNLILCMVVALVIGFILSDYFTLKLYKPLTYIDRKIKSIFNNKSGIYTDISIGFENNEIFSEINAGIDHIQSALQQNSSMIKHGIILGLVHSQIKNVNELNRRLILIDKASAYRYYACMILRCSKKLTKITAAETLNHTKYRIVDYIDNYSDGLFLIATEYNETDILIVANINDNPDLIKERFCKTLLAYIEDKFKLEYKISAGNVYESIDNVPLSFHEASALMEYGFTFSDRYLASNTVQPGRYEKVRYNKLLEEYHKCLIEAKFEKAMNIVKEITSGIKIQPFPIREVFDIINKINRFTDDFIKNNELDENKNMITQKENNTIDNIDDFCQEHLQLVSLIGSRFQLRKVSKNHDRVQAIVDYINDNTYEDLSLSVISDRFDLSKNYISKIFKEEFGINYLDYITKVKLEYAEKQLKHTRMSVNKISEKLGYNSTAHFIKIFRKLYGATPNIYRKKREDVEVLGRVD